MAGYTKVVADPDGEFDLTKENFGKINDAAYDLKHLAFNVKDYGAVSGLSASDPGGLETAPWIAAVTANTVAFQACIDDSVNAPGWLGGSLIFVPDGSYVVNGGLTWPASVTDIYIVGAGKFVSWVTLSDGADRPIIDIAASDPLHDRVMIRDIAFRTQTQTSHPANPPLLRFRRGYLSHFEDMAIWKPPGDGIYYEGQITTGQASVGDVPTFRNCWFAIGGTGHLLHLYNVNNYTIETSDFEILALGKAAIFDDGTIRTHQYHRGTVGPGNHFENNFGGYGFYGSRAMGVTIKENFFGDSHIYLDDESSGNWVQHNELADNSEIINAGWGNHIGPNDGRSFNPKPGVLSVFFPSSHTSDPDESSRTASQFWTGANYNGGTGSIGKTFYRALTATVEEHAGRTPLRIAPNGANGYSAIKDWLVVAGGDYWLDAKFYPEGNPGAVRILLQDVAGPTTFYDSGALSRTYSPDATDYRPYRHQAVVRIPTGVTSCRLLIASENVNTVWVEQCELIPNGVVNGGMEAPAGYTYSGGVANGWTGSGTGTPSQEATIVKSGSAAQKIVCTAGQSYFISQSPTIDTNRFYYLQAWMRVATGLASRAKIGWGTDLTSATASQFLLSQQETGVYRAVTWVGRPNALASLIFGVTSDPDNAATAYFDHIIWLPLKEVVAEKTAISPNIDLSGATVSHVVLVPTIAMRLRRATIVYTEASSADAGVAVRVGTYATNTYFATATSAVSQAQGTQTEMTLTKTDIRAGTPVVVSCAGGKTGIGEIQVALEYE